MNIPARFAVPTLVISPLLLMLSYLAFGNPVPMLIGKKIWLSDQLDRLKAAVLQVIPVGSSVINAKAILEFNGFECVYTKDSDSSDDWDKNRTSKDGDLLFCIKTRSLVVCARTYKPLIHYKNDVTTHVEAFVGGYCL